MQSVAGGAVPEGKRAIPSLDGLRGVAVLLVVAAHLGIMGSAEHFLVKRHQALLGGLFRVDAGDLGVSIFFVISGFLITTLLVKGLDRGERGLGRFYLRRFFRIFPPYYVYLAVVGALWASHRVPMVEGAFVSSIAYVSNYYPYGLSHPESTGWLVGHTWSLSLEEQFYLLWPACLIFLGRRRAAWLGVALLALVPLSRLLTLHLLAGTAYAGQVNRMFHTRVDTIMAGCVLALVGSFPAVQRMLVAGLRHAWTGAVALVLLWLVLRAGFAGGSTVSSLALSVEAWLLAYLVAFAVANARTLTGRLLNWRPLRHLGVISYGLYLWQQLFDGPVHLLQHRWLLPVAILGAAEASYWLVERPSYRVRDRLAGSQ